MGKKHLDTSIVLNELKSGSVFFRKDKISEKPVRPVREERGVRHVRPIAKREIKRHPFDIYRDQLDTLQKMKSEHMIDTGEMKSMAEMVREALDTYIQAKQNRT